ncbi:MAG: hypothetical protein ACXIVD_13945 [Salinarimonas sp.]
MSNIPSPFGSALGSPVGRGASIVPGAESGFTIPTSDTPAGAGDAASGTTQAPLVGPQSAQSAAATEDSQAGPAAQTLGQEYDKLSEGRRQNYASLYNSYFG